MLAESTITVKYKGVPFLVVTETQEGGRKVAVHEFPGSDNRFIEDLGKKSSIFRIIGYVGGSDWAQQAQRLTTVLDEETEGNLELSVFGIIKVKAQTYTKTVQQTSLGRVEFNMTFLVSVDAPSPSIALSTKETVASAALKVLWIIQIIFVIKYVIPKEKISVKAAEYDGIQLTRGVVESVASLGQDVDSVTALSDAMRDNISDLVRDPVAYASALFNDGLLGKVFDTIEVSRDALESMSDLSRSGYNLSVDFGSIDNDLLSNVERSFDIPEFADDTRYRQESNSNRRTITNSVRTAIFVTYLNLAARNEYQTDAEINAVVADIEAIYTNVIMQQSVDPLVAQALDVCRIQALEVLERKIQTTPKVIDLELKIPTVDIEVAYRLYAEDFIRISDLVLKADVLTELNGVLPTKYKDTVKVLKV